MLDTPCSARCSPSHRYTQRLSVSKSSKTTLALEIVELLLDESSTQESFHYNSKKKSISCDIFPPHTGNIEVLQRLTVYPAAYLFHHLFHNPSPVEPP